jgi:hypothetical protein
MPDGVASESVRAGCLPDLDGLDEGRERLSTLRISPYCEGWALSTRRRCLQPKHRVDGRDETEGAAFRLKEHGEALGRASGSIDA